VRLLYIAWFYDSPAVFQGFGWGIPCYRIARYVSIAWGVEFFGTSGTVEVVGVKRLFALWVGIALWIWGTKRQSRWIGTSCAIGATACKKCDKKFNQVLSGCLLYRSNLGYLVLFKNSDYICHSNPNWSQKWKASWYFYLILLQEAMNKLLESFISFIFPDYMLSHSK